MVIAVYSPRLQWFGFLGMSQTYFIGQFEILSEKNLRIFWITLNFLVLFFQRQGRSDSYATEFDLEAEEYVPLPKGDVHKKKEVIQDVTLHDLDIANARPQVIYIAGAFAKYFIFFRTQTC